MNLVMTKKTSFMMVVGAGDGVDVHDNDVHDDDEDDDDEDDGDDNIHLMTIKTHDMAIGRISLDTRLISFLMVATDGLNMTSSLIFFFKYLKLAKGPPSKSKEVPTTHILDQDLMFPKSIKLFEPTPSPWIGVVQTSKAACKQKMSF